MNNDNNHPESNFQNPQEPTPQPSTENPLAAELSHLLKQLAEKQSEVEKFKNEYVRALADLDNYRRRVQKEKDELRKLANISLLEQLLPVLDNLSLGLQSANPSPDQQKFFEGFRMVLNQLKAVLSDNAVRELNPIHQPFNPNEHECIAIRPHDSNPDNSVIEVVRTGYSLTDRLLRPASVIVSSGPPPQEPSSSNQNSPIA